MPIPQDHTISVRPNEPKNQSGESPYKFIAECSCGFQALGFNEEMATYHANNHAGIKRFQGHNVVLSAPVKPEPAAPRKVKSEKNAG